MYLENDKLENISSIIENDGVILYPTDTIWGIGCSAKSDIAIQKIIDLKGRKPEKGFVVLVESIEMLKNYIGSIHPRIETLLFHHHRPITVIYPRAQNLSKLACAPDGSVAIRIVNDEFCKELIWASGLPLISTSANISGQKYPSHFGEIGSDIIQSVDYVVKYRQNDTSQTEPSVIIKMTNKKEFEFIRN